MVTEALLNLEIQVETAPRFRDPKFQVRPVIKNKNLPDNKKHPQFKQLLFDPKHLQCTDMILWDLFGQSSHNLNRHFHQAIKANILLQYGFKNYIDNKTNYNKVHWKLRENFDKTSLTICAQIALDEMRPRNPRNGPELSILAFREKRERKKS